MLPHFLTETDLTQQILLSQLGFMKYSFLSYPTSTHIQNSTIFQSNEIQHSQNCALKNFFGLGEGGRGNWEEGGKLWLG